MVGSASSSLVNHGIPSVDPKLLEFSMNSTKHVSEEQTSSAPRSLINLSSLSPTYSAQLDRCGTSCSEVTLDTSVRSIPSIPTKRRKTKFAPKVPTLSPHDSCVNKTSTCGSCPSSCIPTVSSTSVSVRPQSPASPSKHTKQHIHSLHVQEHQLTQKKISKISAGKHVVTDPSSIPSHSYVGKRRLAENYTKQHDRNKGKDSESVRQKRKTVCESCGANELIYSRTDGTVCIGCGLTQSHSSTLVDEEDNSFLMQATGQTVYYSNDARTNRTGICTGMTWRERCEKDTYNYIWKIAGALGLENAGRVKRVEDLVKFVFTLRESEENEHNIRMRDGQSDIKGGEVVSGHNMSQKQQRRCKQKAITQGKRTLPLAAACFYLIILAEKRAVSLKKMAMAANMKLHELGRVYMQTKETLVARGGWGTFGEFDKPSHEQFLTSLVNELVSNDTLLRLGIDDDEKVGRVLMHGNNVMRFAVHTNILDRRTIGSVLPCVIAISLCITTSCTDSVYMLLESVLEGCEVVKGMHKSLLSAKRIVSRALKDIIEGLLDVAKKHAVVLGCDATTINRKSILMYAQIITDNYDGLAFLATHNVN
eukprot:CFRG1564T1